MRSRGGRDRGRDEGRGDWRRGGREGMKIKKDRGKDRHLKIYKQIEIDRDTMHINR